MCCMSKTRVSLEQHSKLEQTVVLPFRCDVDWQHANFLFGIDEAIHSDMQFLEHWRPRFGANIPRPIFDSMIGKPRYGIEQEVKPEEWISRSHYAPSRLSATVRTLQEVHQNYGTISRRHHAQSLRFATARTLDLQALRPTGLSRDW